MGQNRVASTRNNARRTNAFSPQAFQGGVGLDRSTGPQTPQAPVRGQQGPQQQGTQCPTGQEPRRNPRTGQMTCVPAGGQGNPRTPGAPGTSRPAGPSGPKGY